MATKRADQVGETVPNEEDLNMVTVLFWLVLFCGYAFFGFGDAGYFLNNLDFSKPISWEIMKVGLRTLFLLFGALSSLAWAAHIASELPFEEKE